MKITILGNPLEPVLSLAVEAEFKLTAESEGGQALPENIKQELRRFIGMQHQYERRNS
jgi:hypothetical protein